MVLIKGTMIYESQQEIMDRIEATTDRVVRGPVRVFEDSSSYMAIGAGDVLRLAGNDYLVTGCPRDKHSGFEDQPKYWTKYAVDITTGERKMIKLAFHELFSSSVGPLTIHCRRSPTKESRFLDLVRGNPRFMQGISATDTAGNVVRVVDFIHGESLFNRVAFMDQPHEQYFHEQLPEIMAKLIPSIKALAAVHSAGMHHGDVRGDHLLFEQSSGDCVWIDFDFEVDYLDYDVWGVGTVLNFVVGKGVHTFAVASRRPEHYPLLDQSLDQGDGLCLAPFSVANLRKLFPYIPEQLNQILMRYAVSAVDPYQRLDPLVEDLAAFFRLP